MKKLIILSALFFGMFPLVLLIPLAGEWNEKPVMCASEEETLQSLNTKGEKIRWQKNH